MGDKRINLNRNSDGYLSFSNERAKIRENIDEVDSQIVSLLNRRMNLVEEMAKIKLLCGKPVEDTQREEELIDRIKTITKAEHGCHIEKIYRTIMEQSKSYQRKFFMDNSACENVDGLRFIIINGPNLNLLGKREEAHYGKGTYEELQEFIWDNCREHGDYVGFFQSNHEGDIITKIQNSGDEYDAIVINAGGYTHTSIAILDALRAVNLPTVEVHISNISNRETYRKKSYVSEYADKVVEGKGFDGYIEALEYLRDKL